MKKQKTIKKKVDEKVKPKQSERKLNEGFFRWLIVTAIVIVVSVLLSKSIYLFAFWIAFSAARGFEI